MALAPYYLQLTDGFGNSLPGATAEVRDTDNNLADLFTDEDGNTAASNPISPDSDGLVEFFVAPGQYTVTAQIGASTTQTVTIFVTARDNGSGNYTALGIDSAILAENYVKFAGGSGLQNTNGTAGEATDFPVEEGTWTPVLEGLNVAGSHTYSIQVGHYIRHGRKVFFYGEITVSAFDTDASGRMLITGLPFSVVSAGFRTCASLRLIQAENLPTNYLHIQATTALTRLQFDYMRDTGSATEFTASQFGNGRIMFSGTYETAQ